MQSGRGSQQTPIPPSDTSAEALLFGSQIRAVRPKLPILLMTGYSATAKEIGSQLPVLRKPYQLHELSRELEKLNRES